MAAYVLAEIKITNPDGYKEYTAIVPRRSPNGRKFDPRRQSRCSRATAPTPSRDHPVRVDGGGGAGGFAWYATQGDAPGKQQRPYLPSRASLARSAASSRLALLRVLLEVEAMHRAVQDRREHHGGDPGTAKPDKARRVRRETSPGRERVVQRTHPREIIAGLRNESRKPRPRNPRSPPFLQGAMRGPARTRPRPWKDAPVKT